MTTSQRRIPACSGCGKGVSGEHLEAVPVQVQRDPGERTTLMLCRLCRSVPERTWRLRYQELSTAEDA